MVRAHSRDDPPHLIDGGPPLTLLPSHNYIRSIIATFLERKIHITMAAQAPQLRSLYRRFLREMPTRTPSLLANPSPVQKHIRTDIATQSSANSPSLAHQLQIKSAESRLQEAEQILQFVQQQRLYSTLVERYNPGMNMDEEERVRLTARRVGMELPVEHIKEEKE